MGGLLLGGLLPGLMLACIFALYVALRIRLNPSLAPPIDPVRVTWRERWSSLGKCLPFAVIILMVLGFILFGISTPSEAAATGAVGSMIVAALYGRLNATVLTRALLATARLTSMVFVVIAGAVLFGQILALSGAQASLATWLTHLDLSSTILAALLLFLLLLLGTFVDTLALVVLFAPLYAGLITIKQHPFCKFAIPPLVS